MGSYKHSNKNVREESMKEGVKYYTEEFSGLKRLRCISDYSKTCSNGTYETKFRVNFLIESFSKNQVTPGILMDRILHRASIAVLIPHLHRENCSYYERDDLN